MSSDDKLIHDTGKVCSVWSIIVSTVLLLLAGVAAETYYTFLFTKCIFIVLLASYAYLGYRMWVTADELLTHVEIFPQNSFSLLTVSNVLLLITLFGCTCVTLSKMLIYLFDISVKTCVCVIPAGIIALVIFCLYQKWDKIDAVARRLESQWITEDEMLETEIKKRALQERIKKSKQEKAKRKERRLQKCKKRKTVCSTSLKTCVF